MSGMRSGTEATRVVGGKTVQVDGQTWEFPSEAQCLQCHTSAAGPHAGPGDRPAEWRLRLPAPGRTANQLTTLNSIDTLTPALTQPPDQLPVIPESLRAARRWRTRARAYLHTQLRELPSARRRRAPATIDLRYTTALSATNACDVAPTLGNLGITNARLIAPGSAARSVVVGAHEPHRRGCHAAAGAACDRYRRELQLLTSWINGLASCN